MSNITRNVSILLALGMMSACSHTHPLPYRSSLGAVRAPAFQGKTVAVHLSPPKLAKQYSGKAGGHSFTITRIHGFIQHVYGRFFSAAAKQLRFVDTPAPTGADIELYPEIQLRYAGFLINKCHVTFTLVAKGRTGTELARATESDSYSFTVMRNGGRACEIALYKTLGRVTDAVLNTLKSAPPPAPPRQNPPPKGQPPAPPAGK